jgi:hypothetical protein
LSISMLASPTTGLLESNENLICTAILLPVENVSQLKYCFTKVVRDYNIITIATLIGLSGSEPHKFVNIRVEHF